jgi:hypothetical protein
MNFRDERQHDRFLIELVNELNRLGKLSLLGEAFGVPFPEGLERAERRQLFDVELTFANFSCVVETKVDSNVEWPEGIKRRRREKKSTYVLFEWDFGLLDNIENYAMAGENLFQILEKTLRMTQ